MREIIHTQRLLLKPLNRNYLRQLYKLHSDPEVMKFIRPPDTSIDQTMESINKNLFLSEKELYHGLFMAHRNIDDKFIGWGLICPITGVPLQHIEIGYRLSTPYWGKGYASEICEALINVSRNNIKLSKVCALTNPLNLNSKKVLLKNKFKFMGEIYLYDQTCHYFELKL